MALISAGVSVTITDDSFFIPSAAATTPLLFVATVSEKLQPNGDPALGTYEYDAIRTITSLEQSVRTYGVPLFRRDSNGNAMHGDCRNEYGIFALNQYLNLGNRAYVVRANVNLNDDRNDILDSWESKMQQNGVVVDLATQLGVGYVLESFVTDFLTEYNSENSLIPADAAYRTTVTSAELEDLIINALDHVLGTASNGVDVLFEEATFKHTRPYFIEDHTSVPLLVYADGYTSPSTGTFLGLDGARAEWVTDSLGTVVDGEWTAIEARDFVIDQSILFQDTVEFLSTTSLGSNDAARRSSIVTALAATINSNQDIRSETYEYNLILCPGFYEVVDELVALSVSISSEAFVIADTPMNMDTEDVVAWAATSGRQYSTNVAYYYPHGIASNLDGYEVFCAASGIALRTLTYSDEVSNVWWAPAGLRRGQVSGISQVGYITGTLGTATAFIELNLNLGQRDDLYKLGTNINPIVFFPGRGIIIWGQKTSANAASALDRINVSRLLCFVKRQLRKNAMPFLFEPNDQLTRDSLKAAVDGFLADIVVKRGLYDFATICDSSNNTAYRIDNNELWIDVALKPTKAAEFLYIPIRVVSTGAEI